MHPKFSSALLLPLLAHSAVASYASQCRGACHADQAATGNQVPNTVRINGPSHMVADLSQVSGWEILDCPSDWSKGAVDIRLVCTTEDPEANCHHVLEDGAEHTIVRLPPACGTGPFARVAQWSVSRDQRVPADSVAGRKIRRRNIAPVVAKARLDYNFRAIPEGRGKVTFDVVAAHHPDIRDQIKSTHHVVRALRDAAVDAPAASANFGFPGLPDLPSLPDLPDLPDLPSIPLPTIDFPDLPTSLPDLPDLPDIPSIPIPSIPIPSIPLPTIPLPTITLPDIDFPTIDIPDIDIPFPTEFPLPSLPDLSGGFTKSSGFEAVNFQKNSSLLDESLGCNFGKIGFDQSAKIGVDADILINAGYAFRIAGSLTPPEITDFALAGALSGKIHATFDVDMYLSADILFPPIKLIGVGVPGLFIPGLITLGPKVAISAQLDLVVDVAFAAKIPMTYDFNRLDFVFPESLAPAGGDATESKKSSSFELNVSPGDQTGSFGLHIIPKLEFGIDVLHDLASAEVYVGIDVDATFNSNGTIFPDWSYAGCQDFSVGALAKAGVSAGLFKFLHVGDYIPLWKKRHMVWQHCSKPEDGPTTAILDNGDGTYTNAGGDLVNENGQLIDDKGEVIPDVEAADAAPPPVKGEDGKDIPEEDLILDNGDGTYEDAFGNATNAEGQRISANGTVMACELDLTQPLTDADGAVIPPEEAIFDAGDGTYSNYKCELVNEDGQLIDGNGEVIDFEPFKDETGAEIPAGEVVIDNEDGTYSDAYGNSVDQWGGAIDVDENGDVIPVELTPYPEDDGTQLDRDPEVTDDPAFEIMSPDALEQLALDLINGKAPAAPPATSAPPTEPTTSAPPAETTSVPADTTTVPADPPSTPVDTPSAPETTVAPTTTAPGTTVPVPTGACKASAKKRHVAKRAIKSEPPKPHQTGISKMHVRRRAVLGKRSGFGCSMPSIGGLPMMPATVMDELARLF